MRRFLFLQGPHGPFFGALARRLVEAGHDVSRVVFNAGDAFFWDKTLHSVPFHEGLSDWPDWLASLIDQSRVTDIVCYGASRPIHADARAVATRLGLRQHVFEEGYLRPYWVTYERAGTNAESPLMNISLDEMAAAIKGHQAALRRTPDRWGDMKSHVFWGAAYHAALLAGQRRFPDFSPHRTPSPRDELRLYARHLAALPLRRAKRQITTCRVLRGAFPYHVVLLQLAHDANFRDGGPIRSQSAFIQAVCRSFARGAPPHHHLVLKAHPLEDGREPLAPILRRAAEDHDIAARVHLITGGTLARILDDAESAVTVNSTAAEPALWRGLPVRALGDAIYNRPRLTSNQPLPAFFAAPSGPNPDAYAVYRKFLLATSQVGGGFYSATGRRRLLRSLPDMMLSETCPYVALNAPAAAVQHISAVR